MITVLIADDHPVVRSGLTLLFGSTADLKVVGSACDGREAVAMTAALAPDIVLMDLSMPYLDGIEATRQIAASSRRSSVVALTSFSDRDRIVATLDAGAIGYVLKDAAPEDIVRAVRAAAAGESPIDPKAAQVLLRSPAAKGGPGRDLTAREKEVLGLLSEGCSNRIMASRLGISEATVKAHLTHVFQSLGVRDRTQAAVWAHTHGFGSRNGRVGLAPAL
jgi:DNA-binding NarL/FixJ family response regulator